MSDKSAIEWTDATWNVVTGCTRISEGCRNCYIETTPPFRINGIKFRKDGEPSHEIGSATGVTLHPDRLGNPLKWKKPRRVFVNSLSDLFHEDVPTAFISAVFTVMALTPHHTYQVLTKRPRRMQNLLSDVSWWRNIFVSGGRVLPSSIIRMAADTDRSITWPLPNVWLGTSVEDQKAADLRIPLLLETPAAVRFLSCEPLLGPVDLTMHVDRLRAAFGAVPIECEHGYDCCPVCDVNRIHWVIAGGESGPKARPMHPNWARSLRDQCVDANVPFFHKQNGEWAPERFTEGPSFDLPTLRSDECVFADAPRGWQVLRRIGKKNAGRELDGRTWDQFPEVSAGNVGAGAT